MRWPRLFRHWLHPDWLTRLAFPAAALDRIEAAVAEAERVQGAELRFVVEGALDTPALLRGVSARERALQVFSDLRVWDTEHNNGVLIYLLLADHDVEIVADRGLNGRVDADQWRAVCAQMETCFARGDYTQGALLGIERVAALLAQHYPAKPVGELENRPALM
jgi:uncharacterized membrane protein